jgi:oxygen-dependent protoporphyrinogen oxidase
VPTFLAVAESIAVVGSGPSGLAAAWCARRAGYQVTIFESNNYLGGKMKTGRRDRFLIEEGPSLVSTSYRAILRILVEVGLADQLVPAGSIIGIPRDGVMHQLDCHRIGRDFAGTRLLSARSKLLLGRLLTDCIRHRARLSDPSRLVELAGIDTESAAGYGRRRLNAELLDYLVEPMGRALVGSSPEDISVVDLLYAWTGFLGRVGFVALRDGMSSYPDALGRRMRTRLNAPVHAVRRTGSGVRLSWRNESASGTSTESSTEFAGCVLAVSAPVAAKIYPDLDPWRTTFLTDVAYTSVLNLSIALDRPPAGSRAMYLLPSAASTPELLGVILEHNKAPGRAPAGRGLIALYASPEFSARHRHDPDDTCISQLLAANERLLPGSRDTVRFTQLHRWDSLAIRSRPGYYRDLARFAAISRERDSVIQLAGDYFAPSNLNSATSAGERAARDVVAALRGPRVGH